ncbi:MAG: TolC family protein [Proteiniphilum sp.]|jgi:cobalt-zinc-cadmium efflux system outer membrane protein|uniref:TolC family protein n=1 Tax=Proteiniphilum sp. TaxID=1926877 RepID=UPI002B1F45C4|nr:TolC family protein [Proteiniphilum sp.]MEA5127624.1 TolC family protein [Proteiniphilum sp.]
MKTIIITLLILFMCVTLNAQTSINSVLASIEEHNTTLKSLRESAEAQKLENRTDIYLENPEVGFNYLWGNPSDIGKRTDISVMQSFDMATITGAKRKVADRQNVLVDWQYKADRMNILLEAKQYCIDLIYYNALKKELNLRLQHAETIAAGYEGRLNSGDVSRLEYNKVQLNLSTVQGEISRIDVERNALLEQLKRLNGGTDILLEDDRYDEVLLPPYFDDWFEQAAEKNPVLAYARQEIEVSKQQVSLNKMKGLPTLSAGYMSEKLVGEHFQGLSVGISIPLWENKNRVKQAKASVRAAESRETDSRLQFYNQLQILYNRTAGLKAASEKYRQSLITANNTELLKKALDAGEISLLEYMVEMGLYYETINQALETERDYHKAFAELSAIEL